MEILLQTYSNAIGWSILHSLWQGACIYLILFGLILLIPQGHSSLKYKISLSAQILLFTSFVYTFYSYLNIDPISPKELKLSEHEEMALYLAYLKGKKWSITEVFPFLVTLYTIGIAVQIFFCAKSFNSLRKLKNGDPSIVPAEWQEALLKISRKITINKQVKLLVSEYITTPITIGVIKPLIIFPTAYINQISTKEAEAILIHEIGHIKNYDYVLNIVLIAIETLLFFNPFVWLISKHVKTEREHACDDFANAYLNTPLAYAKTLLKIELLRQENAPTFALAATGNNRYNLLDRIKRINNKTMETKHTSVKHQLTAILLVSLTLITVAWVNPSNAKNSSMEKGNNFLPLNKNIIASSSDKLSNQDTIKPLKLGKIENTIVVTNDTIGNWGKIVENQEFKELAAKIELENKNIQSYFESPEWKKKILDIEKNAADFQKQFDSPEWKEKLATIEANARQVEEYFKSAAWKEQIKKIEADSKKVAEQFESTEWKNKIALIEGNARQIEAFYNSPEYKKKIEAIEENARKVEALYNSPEYKKRIEAIEENARKIEALYNSPEYKNSQK